jgi:hypothetical protein
MKVKAELVDVHGSLRRLVIMGPKVFRGFIKPQIQVSAHAVAARARTLAPVGEAMPKGRRHIRDGIEVAVHPVKLFADVGFFSNPDEAAVAIYNEYTPNRQPFLRPALEAEEREYHTRFVKALRAAAGELSSEP